MVHGVVWWEKVCVVSPARLADVGVISHVVLALSVLALSVLAVEFLRRLRDPPAVAGMDPRCSLSDLHGSVRCQEYLGWTLSLSFLLRSFITTQSPGWKIMEWGGGW